MYSNIMVPLDGSQFSESALPAAVDLARRAGARLHIVQVVAWHDDIVQPPEPSVRNYVKSLAETAARENGIECIGTTLLDPATAVDYAEPPVAIIERLLEEYIGQHHIDLTVLASHGRGGFKRAWLGSVADRLLRSVHSSFLILKPKPRAFRPRSPFLPRQILVAVDIDGRAEEVIASVLDLGELYNAEFTLMHVSPPALLPATVGVFQIMQSTSELRAPTELRMQVLASMISDRGWTVRVEHTESPFVATDILGYARSHNFDMIAVATRGADPFRRAMLGSVADKIVRGTPLPVLACHFEEAGQ